MRRWLALRPLLAASALTATRPPFVPTAADFRSTAGFRSAPVSKAVTAPAASDVAVAEALQEQLGYVPTNLLRVAAWTADATPAVILAHPLVEKKKGGVVEPFPTTYWLTCPVISAAVATLERDGGVKAAAAAIFDEGEGGADAMAAAHESYAQLRWSLLSDDEATLVEARGWTPNLQDVGVAGLRDAKTVKCLHAHYAHFLGDRSAANPVGVWVHDALPREVRDWANGGPPDA